MKLEVIPVVREQVILGFSLALLAGGVLAATLAIRDTAVLSAACFSAFAAIALAEFLRPRRAREPALQLAAGDGVEFAGTFGVLTSLWPIYVLAGATVAAGAFLKPSWGLSLVAGFWFLYAARCLRRARILREYEHWENGRLAARRARRLRDRGGTASQFDFYLVPN